MERMLLLKRRRNTLRILKNEVSFKALIIHGGRKMSKQIAVLSDTHGLLRPEVLEKIAGCDVIIHGGDINRQEILDQLEKIAPVYVVRGNNDKAWAENIPETLTFQIEECRFFMVHNKKFVPEELADIDVVIFGHSHKYVEKYV